MSRIFKITAIVILLLTGAQAMAHIETDSLERVLFLPKGPDNPRNSEGDFITLKDGRILYVYSHYTGDSYMDDAPAFLAGRYSSDNGKTWTTQDQLIVKQEGKLNVMSVSLLRLQNGEIALFYLRKDSPTDCMPMVRFTSDEGETWTSPRECISDRKGYFILHNDRVIQLRDGRLVFSVAFARKVCSYYSDDNGRSWKSGAIMPNPDSVVTQEPGIVELKDGSIMMIMRTDTTTQYVSFSRDRGESWSAAKYSNIVSATQSPASISRIPSTGHLMLVWNDNHASKQPAKAGRTPLNVAISKDEGLTWQQNKIIEGNPQGSYCYTAIHFAGDYTLLAYFDWATLQITITRVKTDWIYDSPETVLALPPGENNPRNSEGDFITLKSGRMLYVYTHFTGDSYMDDAPAYIASRYSDDGGKTWSKQDEKIMQHEGGKNLMSVSLLRLQNGKIAMFYLRKNSTWDCIPFVRFSNDETVSWSKPVRCISEKGYFVVNNDRVIQLKNGRILIPASRHEVKEGGEWDKNSEMGTMITYYSDDGGLNWKKGGTVKNPDKAIHQEPGIVQLSNGNIMMLIRADRNAQYTSLSKDGGITWTPSHSSEIRSPLSPASISADPYNKGRLVLVWNNNNGDNPLIKGKRTPLTIAISGDDGKSWCKTRNIEVNPGGSYCYTAIHFTEDNILLGYFDWATRQIVLKKLSRAWLEN